jgi:hypothetical protein
VPFDVGQPSNEFELRQALDSLSRRVNPVLPQARVYNDANLSINNTTFTALTFNSERFDNGSLHSTSANTGRLTAPITGLYMVGAHAVFASNATGFRVIQLRVNGTTVIEYENKGAVNGDVTGVGARTLYQMAATDYVEVVVYQSSGGALNVSATANYSPEFWMVRLGGYVNMGVN